MPASSMCCMMPPMTISSAVGEGIDNPPQLRLPGNLSIRIGRSCEYSTACFMYCIIESSSNRRITMARPPEPHKKDAPETGKANFLGSLDRLFWRGDPLRRELARMSSSSSNFPKRLRSSAKVDGFGRGADDVHACSFERQREVQRSLSAELHDHADRAPSLVDAAHLAGGERVLDLACGTGVVTRIAAQRVGPQGRVTGVDLNTGMISVARSLPAPDGGPVEWLEGSALAIPLPDASVNVVLCQQGLQFFLDKALALLEMRRVLDRGGRLALSVWSSTGVYNSAVGKSTCPIRRRRHGCALSCFAQGARKGGARAPCRRGELFRCERARQPK